ncbi:MAG: tandem-95 repeat protein [Planctomycetes bacterium]|nr:tandem-95 repeat protein [Planctomycetota bacterium]
MRKRGDRYAALTIERLEDRDLLNAAPMINSAMLDSFSPKTNDILTVNVSASDADSDPLTFDYVWKVNGNTVKSTLGTSSTNDTLDLSVSGNGNKGDYVSVVITPYDPYTSGMTANPGATIANSAPTFSMSNQENLRGDVVSLQVNVSDADGDTLSYSAMALPPGLSINSSTGLISGTVSSSAVTNQAYLASVSVNDGSGNVNQNFSWTIVNHAPTAGDLGTYYIHPNATLNVPAANGIMTVASDEDGDTLTSSLVSWPTHGMATVYSDGSFSYTPTTNYDGTDSFTVKVNDGAADSNTATVYVSVGNQAPTVQSQYISVDLSEVLYNIDPLASDLDGDSLQIYFSGSPSHGQLTLETNGTFTYSAPSDWSGIEVFNVWANDGTTDGPSATLTFNVGNVAPTADDDEYWLVHDRVLEINVANGVLANDWDEDQDALTVVLVDEPAYGAVTLADDGSFIYTPEQGYVGTVIFSYYATDGVGDSSTTTVTVNVTNETALGVDDAFTVEPDADLIVTGEELLGNDFDPDGETPTASLVANSGPTHGTLEYFDTDGSFKYTPDENSTGLDEFQYVLSDGVAQSDPVTVAINVQAGPAANIINTRGNDRGVSAALPGAVVGGIKQLNIRVVGAGNATLTISTQAGTGTAFFINEPFTPEDSTTVPGKATTTISIYGGTVSSQARNMRLTATVGGNTVATWDFTVFTVAIVPITSGATNAALRNASNARNQPLTASLPGMLGHSQDARRAVGAIVFRGEISPIGIDPTDFNRASNRNESFMFDRRVSGRTYKNDTQLLEAPVGDPVDFVLNEEDTSDQTERRVAGALPVYDFDKDLRADTDGTAGNTRLYVWDTDAPQMGGSGIPNNGDFKRVRDQFYETARYAGVAVSPTVPWYWVASQSKNNGIFGQRNDLQTQGDNRVVAGTTTGTLTAATNATPIVITTGSTANLATGRTVTIAGVNGNTAANGTFVITVLSATTFALTGSIGNGAYTGGGSWSSEAIINLTRNLAPSALPNFTITGFEARVNNQVVTAVTRQDVVLFTISGTGLTAGGAANVAELTRAYIYQEDTSGPHVWRKTFIILGFDQRTATSITGGFVVPNNFPLAVNYSSAGWKLVLMIEGKAVIFNNPVTINP